MLYQEKSGNPDKKAAAQDLGLAAAANQMRNKSAKRTRRNTFEALAMGSSKPLSRRDGNDNEGFSQGCQIFLGT
jgi:hypothetical protein